MIKRIKSRVGADDSPELPTEIAEVLKDRGNEARAPETLLDDGGDAELGKQLVTAAAIRMDFEVLIPIWGESYIKRFAELGLRSLLAPGNLPWLGRRHNLKFTVLTTPQGSEQFQGCASFSALTELAEISFVHIDDLLLAYGRNYAVILTRAYNRAMALSGNIIGRNFIYLVGDQIFADGSLQAVAAAMEAGNDACLACTPRVDADVIEQRLLAAGTPTELVVSSRELANLVVNYLHPTAVAKMVQNDKIHLSIAHQFFWRPEPDTLVSRCFLLHMLCIRPTCRPRDIAAPCDFAFVAELTPGGRYHYPTDSDTFLVLELQNSEHETEFITSFELGPTDIAEAISAWASPIHHQLANTTFLFRSGDSTYPMEKAVALTQPYIDKLFDHLPPARDHRYHPFWLGAVGAQVLRPTARSGRDLTEIQPKLAALIDAHMDRLGPVELGVSVCNYPSPVDDVVVRSARAAVRITPAIFHRQIEDVAAPGGNILIVQDGQMTDFLQLFSDRQHLLRLLRVAGPGRAILLSYSVTLNDLRNGNLSRGQLHRIFTARLSLFSRFGLWPNIHDLAVSPLDRLRGFVIEIVGDEAMTPQSVSRQPFGDGREDPFFGERGLPVGPG